jgi:positive regulator of sigma E activity
MPTAIQTKLLIAVVVLLGGVCSYLAYERHERNVEQQKIDQAVHELKTEGQKELPSGWAKSLKSK